MPRSSLQSAITRVKSNRRRRVMRRNNRTVKGRYAGVWSDYVSPSMSRIGRRISPTVRGIGRLARAIGRTGRYTARKLYQGGAYVSPTIYRTTKHAAELASPYLAAAARSTANAANQYIVSPTIQYTKRQLAAMRRAAAKHAKEAAYQFHEYMMYDDDVERAAKRAERLAGMAPQL